MLVLSSSSPPILEVFKDRVSSSSCSSSSSSSSSSFALVLRRSCFRRPLLCCCASNLKLMPDSAPPSLVQVVGSGEVKDEDQVNNNKIVPLHSRTFLNARSGEELLAGIKRESELGTLPVNIASAMEELYQNYRNGVLSSGIPHADEIALSNMSALLDLVLLDVENPFEFSPYHKAVREPYDYYVFGQNYIRPLIDFGNSYVGNLSLFYDIEEKLRQGHNVVLMSNHQSEADPAVIALLLENTNLHIAENMIYIAGDRVLSDPLCKPFSMGRNLLCVYSKKHMYDVPELVDMKRRANTRSLKEMALLLRRGSQIIWIAPSGGRDRPDPATQEWQPASFDVASVDNMRRLVQHAGVPGHIYPLAILCYDIMPPPPQVEREIGEKRLISFHGAGLSVAPGVSYNDIAPGGNEEEAKLGYAKALYDSVNEQYKVLKAAVHGKQGLGASTPTILLSQPWT